MSEHRPSDKHDLTWEQDGKIKRAKVTFDNIAASFELFKPRARYEEQTPEHTANVLRAEMQAARPAFQLFFERTLEAIEHRTRADLAMIALHLAEVDSGKYEAPEAQIKHQSLCASSISHSTVAEHFASALLLQIDTILIGTIGEIRQSRHPASLGVGRCVNGVKLDDLLRACGNYCRHGDEWRWVHFNAERFSNAQQVSITTIATALKFMGTGVDEAYKYLLSSPEPMRQSLDAIRRTKPSMMTSYDDFEGEMLALAEAIVQKLFA